VLTFSSSGNNEEEELEEAIHYHGFNDEKSIVSSMTPLLANTHPSRVSRGASTN
jgi:hypothetical protein